MAAWYVALPARALPIGETLSQTGGGCNVPRAMREEGRTLESVDRALGAARRARRAAVRRPRERARAAHRHQPEHGLAAARDAHGPGLRGSRRRRRRATASACAWSPTRTPSWPASTCGRSRGPHLERLVAQTGETATLSVPGGTQPFTIDFVPSPSNVASRAELGRPSVTHATVTGKLLLAFGPLPLERLGPEPYERFTDRTLTTRAELAREVERVRARRRGVRSRGARAGPQRGRGGGARPRAGAPRDAQHPGSRSKPPARPPHAGPGLRAQSEAARARSAPRSGAPGGLGRDLGGASPRPAPRAASSALSVRSHVKSSSSRPKCP